MIFDTGRESPTWSLPPKPPLICETDKEVTSTAAHTPDISFIESPHYHSIKPRCPPKPPVRPNSPIPTQATPLPDRHRLINHIRTHCYLRESPHLGRVNEIIREMRYHERELKRLTRELGQIPMEATVHAPVPSFGSEFEDKEEYSALQIPLTEHMVRFPESPEAAETPRIKVQVFKRPSRPPRK